MNCFSVVISPLELDDLSKASTLARAKFEPVTGQSQGVNPYNYSAAIRFAYLLSDIIRYSIICRSSIRNRAHFS